MNIGNIYEIQWFDPSVSFVLDIRRDDIVQYIKNLNNRVHVFYHFRTKQVYTLVDLWYVLKEL